MDTENLRTFITVAECNSFSVAAAQLHLTQPAVSKRIAALEQHLNVKLFDRIGRHAHLTEAGKALMPRAQHILNELEDSRRLLDNLTDEVKGRLSVGTSHHIGLHRLPPVLRRFVQHYPQVELDLQFMDSEAACAAVEHGDLELGIVTLPPNPSDKLELIPVWADPLAIVVGAEHPLGNRKQIALNQIADYPAILPAAGTYTRQLAETALEPYGLHLVTGLSTNYLETIKMLVSVGLGWSILPCSMLDEQLHALRVPGFKLERTLGVVRHKNRTLSNAAKQLILALGA